MIYLHARGLYHVLLLICNRELLFIGKRKDEDDVPLALTVHNGKSKGWKNA